MPDSTPARYQFPELIRSDDEFSAHVYAQPSDLAPDHRRDAWVARMLDLRAERRRLLDEIEPLLCGRCHGTGTTKYKHMHGGICYQCKGDGWSTRRRR